MSIRKYPAGNQDRDTSIAPKRDSHMTFGTFGVIVYTYRLALEPKQLEGKLYHPVETAAEASYWLDYYKKKTQIIGFVARPEYEEAYFVPNPNGEL